MSFIIQRPEDPIIRRTQGSRILIVDKPIGEPPSSGAATFGATVSKPSGRMRVKLSMFWNKLRLSNSGQFAALGASAVGYIQAVTNVVTLQAAEPVDQAENSSGLISNLEAGTLHNLITGGLLPLAYEGVTGISRFEVYGTITAPTVSAAKFFPYWVLRATFEPISKDAYDDAELEKVFNGCLLR